MIDQWHEQERIYNGTGTTNLYSGMAIITAHEIRRVFKLPLRQCEGFINSLFKIMDVELCCPSYSVLSKRFHELQEQVFVLTAMIDRFYLVMMQHLPEISKEMAEEAIASAKRRHVKWLGAVERFLNGDEKSLISSKKQEG